MTTRRQVAAHAIKRGHKYVMAESSDKLAAALEAIPGCPPEMAACTRYGYYHDYESPLATPELQLIADLRVLARAPGTPAKSRPMWEALIQQVMAGEFDATIAESDAWSVSDEGQAAVRSLMGNRMPFGDPPPSVKVQ